MTLPFWPCFEGGTLFNRAQSFDEIVAGESNNCSIESGDTGRLFVAMDRGRTVTCIYEFYNDGSKTGAFVDDLNMKLLDNGAYFDTPQGELSKAVFVRIDGCAQQLKRVKNMLDPKGILNPGILRF